MADISQITLLDGSVVNLKDSAGREATSTGLLGKVSIAQGVQNKGKILQVSNGGSLELVDPEFGSGDVIGPSSASNNNVVVFDGATGKLVKDSGFTIGKSVPSDAVFTDTTYESKSAASGGTDESLVTTGEKYIWNGKTSNVGTVTGVKMNNGSAIDPDANGIVDLGTVITSHQDISGKADLVDGKVPSTQLPSYVDDVLEYSSQSSFPLTGEIGKIYIAQDTNKTYRWSGSAYVEISESLALGETSSSAYRGDRGAEAYAAAVTNVDSTPTTNSTHLVTSGGVKAALPSDMTGASSSAAGTHGLVPAPAQGDQDKYLKGDGTWDAFSVTSLYRQFWTSTQEITLTLATDSKTYLIYCSGSSSGESGALADSEHGACIIVSNGKYIVLHKGSDITITEASSILTIDSDENIAMGIIEL